MVAEGHGGPKRSGRLISRTPPLLRGGVARVRGRPAVVLQPRCLGRPRSDELRCVDTLNLLRESWAPSAHRHVEPWTVRRGFAEDVGPRGWGQARDLSPGMAAPTAGQVHRARSRVRQGRETTLWSTSSTSAGAPLREALSVTLVDDDCPGLQGPTRSPNGTRVGGLMGHPIAGINFEAANEPTGARGVRQGSVSDCPTRGAACATARRTPPPRCNSRRRWIPPDDGQDTRPTPESGPARGGGARLTGLQPR